MFNGPILKMIASDATGMICAAGTYFDMIATCGAVGAEYQELGATVVGTDMPVRDRADMLAGDPLAFGHGRAAAIGLSVVVTVPTSTGRAVLVGRRRADLAADPSRLHVIPSGMVEPSRGASPILEAAQRELDEELGLLLTTRVLIGRLQLLGTAFDLLRLRPEICLRLDLCPHEAAGLDSRNPSAEFESIVEIPIEELPQFVTSDTGLALTPAAAGALALMVERPSLPGPDCHHGKVHQRQESDANRAGL